MKNWPIAKAESIFKKLSMRASLIAAATSAAVLIAAVLIAANISMLDAKCSNAKSINPKLGYAKPSRAAIKTISFPKSYSLGLLYIIPFKPNELAAYTQKAISRQKAQGEVQLRHNGMVLLTGSYQLAENMSVLKTLKPDDLQVLDMYRTDIADKDIPNILGLTGLIGLQLDDTEIGDESLKTICHLPNLKFLDVSSTQVTGSSIASLKVLKQLRRLELGHNVIKKEYLSELIKLKQIERLGLQGCQINDKDLETIGKLDNLLCLLLLENSQITDIGLKKLAGLKKLSVFEITHAQITPNGLKGLSHLPIKRLTIGKNQFSPSQIARIKKIFPLAEVTVYDNSNRMDPDLFQPLH